MKLEDWKIESVRQDARSSVINLDRGFGAFHAAGYARGAIETLWNLGLLSASEFKRLEHTVMIAEADADMELDVHDDEH